MRLKICLKEARESGLWLDLLKLGVDSKLDSTRRDLRRECEELVKIFAVLIRKARA